MPRYIKNEIVTAQLPQLNERGQHHTLVLNAGSILYQIMITKTEDLTGVEESVLRGFYKSIDPKYTGACQVPENEWIELTDPQFEILLKRLDHKLQSGQKASWFPNVDHPIVFDMVKAFREAPPKRPKELPAIAERPSDNGVVDKERVEA